jgi:2-oxoglutarate ferredoxin oxidoreductase subunit gamma
MITASALRGDIEVVEVPTSELAEQLGTIKVANMVMLGAFIKVSTMVSFQGLLKNLPEILGASRAKLIKTNRDALELGFNYIKE